MRDPASPNDAKIPAVAEATGALVVSTPDRRRIDSDVRAFLREPSTPWIVFDQEGRPPSQLAVGEVLPARRAILSEHGFFLATRAIDAVASGAAALEPSSLAVAADLVADAARALPSSSSDDQAASRVRSGLRGRVLGASAAAAAMVVTLVVGTLVVRGVADTDPLAAGRASSALAAAPAPAEQGRDAPSAFDVSAAAAQLGAAPPAAAAAAPSPAPADGAARKLGRLTVTGDARSRDVYMDGKRMLGRGARSFTVMCGPHTIAVGARSDVRDVEIPCTGSAELVVSK